MKARAWSGTPPGGSSLSPTGASFATSSDSELVRFTPFVYQGSTVYLVVTNTSSLDLKIDGSAWFSPWFHNHDHDQIELPAGARCYFTFETTPTINETREWHVLCRFSKTGLLSFLDDDVMAVVLELKVS